MRGGPQQCHAGTSHESAKHNQANQDVKVTYNLKREALKWMQEWQCSYTDEQLSFWTLLCLLTGSGETSSQHLAHWLLLVWHWSLVLDPLACPPIPSQLNIGHWIREDCDVSKHQKWIKTYACALQQVAEASGGCSWTTEGQAMTPEVSKLVHTFLSAMGMCIMLCIIREC